MTSKKTNQLFPELLGSLLILLFVYTATSKLLNRPAFSDVLMASPIIGNYAIFMSWCIPLSEILVSVLLLIPAARFIGFCISLLLLISFSLYIIYMLLSGLQLPCSCGGVIQLLSWKQHLAFNLLFICIAAAGVVVQGKSAIDKSVWKYADGLR